MREDLSPFLCKRCRVVRLIVRFVKCGYCLKCQDIKVRWKYRSEISRRYREIQNSWRNEGGLRTAELVRELRVFILSKRTRLVLTGKL